MLGIRGWVYDNKLLVLCPLQIILIVHQTGGYLLRLDIINNLILYCFSEWKLMWLWLQAMLSHNVRDVQQMESPLSHKQNML